MDVDEVHIEDATDDGVEEREDAHLDREHPLGANCVAMAIPDVDAQRRDARNDRDHRLSATKVLGQTRLLGGLLVPFWDFFCLRSLPTLSSEMLTSGSFMTTAPAPCEELDAVELWASGRMCAWPTAPHVRVPGGTCAGVPDMIDRTAG